MSATTLAYAPAVPGQPTAVSLGFTLDVDLITNEHVLLTLPGFTLAPASSSASSALVLAGASAGLFSEATWNSSAAVLTLVVGYCDLIPAGTAVALTLGDASAAGATYAPAGTAAVRSLALPTAGHRHQWAGCFMVWTATTKMCRTSSHAALLTLR